MATTMRIYYHKDLDGLFSAIFYSKLLTDNNFTNIKFMYEPVNYDLLEWQERNLKSEHPKESLIVVDFPYSSACDIWFDHHESGLGKFPIDTKFQGRFDPTAPSCCHVIYHMENRDKYKDEDLMFKIVQEVNMIDQALYPTIDTVYNGTTFGPKFRFALYEEGTEECYNELIRMFTHDRTLLYKLLDGFLPWSVDWRYQRFKVRLKDGYEAFKKVAKLENDIVVFTCPQYVKFDRYFPFRLFPNAKYTCYIQDFRWTDGVSCHIGVAKNPWDIQDKSVNIKEICEMFGGGGHEAVGGIALKTTIEEVEKIQKIIVDLLHNNGKQTSEILDIIKQMKGEK